jgi:hypothetical protein
VGKYKIQQESVHAAMLYLKGMLKIHTDQHQFCHGRARDAVKTKNKVSSLFNIPTFSGLIYGTHEEDVVIGDGGGM